MKMNWAVIFFLPFLCLLAGLTAPVWSQTTSAASAPSFDVKAAVDAYLAQVPADQRARADANFEGGYWLLLWDFLSTVLVMWILLRFRWPAWMRDLAERLIRFRALQTVIYWIQFVVAVAVITFPLTIYEGYFREHQYLLSNQTLGQCMQDQAGGAGGSFGAGIPSGGDPGWSSQADGQKLVVVGKCSVDAVYRVRVIDCAGVYFSPVQQVHQAGGSALQRADLKIGTGEWNSGDRCLRV